MEIPREKIDEILARTDIGALISQYVTLKPSGKDLKGLCPFHTEKTPSFLVHPDRGFFKCFGCGEGGGPIQFLMKIEGIPFGEAIGILANRAGITLSTSEGERKRLSEKSILIKVLTAAAHYYNETLIKAAVGKTALNYALQRGLSQKTLTDFNMGYAPGGGDFLARHLRGLKISYEAMERAGIVRRSNRGDYYDYFRDRLMFPIADSQGRIVGMGGRAMSAEVQSKYLNSPETPIFFKRHILYGLSVAKPSIRKEEQVYVVEGYMDAVSMYQGGFTNVVASMGTSLSEEQARAISRYTKNVILAYDADTAGATATDRGIEIFEKAGLYVKVMEMPIGEDPDSIIRKQGSAYFSSLAANAKGIIEYKIDNLVSKYDMRSPESKQEFVRELVPVLKEVKGEIRLSEYIRVLSQRHNIPEESLRKIVAGTRVKKQIPDENPVFTKKLKLPEEILLNCILTNPSYISICREYSINEKCMKSAYFSVYTALLNAEIEGTEPLSVDILSRIFRTEEQLKTAIDLSVKEGANGCNEEQVRILLKKIEHRRIKDERELSFRQKLAEGKLDYNDPDFREYIESLRKMKSPGANN
ncbi:MAG: DNA primase [Firmicutes bacterium]|nr:DNA primase [Bacillota bacterium]